MWLDIKYWFEDNWKYLLGIILTCILMYVGLLWFFLDRHDKQMEIEKVKQELALKEKNKYKPYTLDKTIKLKKGMDSLVEQMLSIDDTIDEELSTYNPINITDSYYNSNDMSLKGLYNQYKDVYNFKSTCNNYKIKFNDGDNKDKSISEDYHKNCQYYLVDTLEFYDKLKEKDLEYGANHTYYMLDEVYTQRLLIDKIKENINTVQDKQYQENLNKISNILRASNNIKFRAISGINMMFTSGEWYDKNEIVRLRETYDKNFKDAQYLDEKALQYLKDVYKDLK